MTRFSKKGLKKMAEVMKDFEQGTLKLGTLDEPVTSHSKAAAIALKEARKAETKTIKKKSYSEKKRYTK